MYAAGYEPGELVLHASPSLFGGAKCVVVHDLDEAGEELQADLLGRARRRARARPHPRRPPQGRPARQEGARHDAGSGARVIEAPAVKIRPRQGRVRRARVPAGAAQGHGEAVHALVEAVGQGRARARRRLPAARRRHHGVIDEQVVLTYHGGQGGGHRLPGRRRRGGRRRRRGDAAAPARHRRRGRPGAHRRRPRPAGPPAHPGRAPPAGAAPPTSPASSGWPRGRSTRRGGALGGWTAEALATCVHALAAADAEVKGGGRDPVCAVERAVLTITAQHGAGAATAWARPALRAVLAGRAAHW